MGAILDADSTLAVARDGDGVSAVMHALYHGQREVAEVVAGRLPAVDVFEAAGLGRADAVARLVAGDPSLAGAWSADGFTALHFAAFFGGEGAAAALLAAGADPNLRSRNELEVMPIHSAVAGGHREVVIALLEAGADPNVRQRHGWTPLQGAAQHGDAELVDRLLAAGADPAAANDAGHHCRRPGPRRGSRGTRGAARGPGRRRGVTGSQGFVAERLGSRPFAPRT